MGHETCFQIGQHLGNQTRCGQFVRIKNVLGSGLHRWTLAMQHATGHTRNSVHNVVASSSGEAGYYGMVRRAPVARGQQALLEDSFKSDASAAIAMASMRGCGK
eukprot:3759243-Pyramimonas_sp.AAC.1